MPCIEAKCGREPRQVCEAPEEQGETPGKGGLREGFGDQQQNSLEDYVEATIMLQYNKR